MSPVEVRRTGKSNFEATNGRGGSVPIAAAGQPDSFSPGELLLAAIAGCAQLSGEKLLTRRLGEDAAITVRADRTLDPQDPKLFESARVTFDVDFSSVTDETERAKLVDAVHLAIERACTVSRSVEKGTPVTVEIPTDRSA